MARTLQVESINSSSTGLDLQTLNASRLFINNSGNVGIGLGAVSPISPLHIGFSNTALPTTGGGSIIQFTNTDLTTSSTSSILFAGYDAGGTSRHAAAISWIKTGSWTSGGNNYGSALIFSTRVDAGNTVENFRITSSGGISFGSSGTAFGTSNQVLKSNGNTSPTWILLGNDNIDPSAAIAYSKLNLATSIVNSDISASAAIAVSKLAASTISGITLGSNLGTLTFGTHLTGTSYNGSTGVTIATNATNANTGSTIVARDASGNFSAGTITASLSGNSTSVTDGVYLSTAQTVSGRKIFTSSMTGGAIASSTTANLGGIEVQCSGENASLIAFHRASNYASYFGIDTDNQFAVGGWSAGAALANMKVGSFGVGTAASGTAGEIRATNNITAYYSDERLKNFIGKISNALDKVNSLNGYYYKENSKAKELGYNNDSVQVGVSAQEVEKILPEIVTLAPIDCSTDSTGKTTSKTGQNYKTVYYEKIIPLLIEAIKELSVEVNKLKENK